MRWKQNCLIVNIVLSLTVVLSLTPLGSQCSAASPAQPQSYEKRPADSFKKGVACWQRKQYRRALSYAHLAARQNPIRQKHFGWPGIACLSWIARKRR